MVALSHFMIALSGSAIICDLNPIFLTGSPIE